MIFHARTTAVKPQNSDSLYSRGASWVSFSVWPDVNKIDYPNQMRVGCLVSPSIAYYVINRFQLSTSLLYSGKYFNYSFIDTVASTHLITVSPSLRYYTRMLFFFEVNYTYGTYRVRGEMRYNQEVNHAGFGVGLHRDLSSFTRFKNSRAGIEFVYKLFVPLKKFKQNALYNN